MNKTTLYFPAELHRALREAARRAGKSQADVVREAVERYLQGVERPRPKSIGVAADETLRARDLDPWLEREWKMQ